MSVMGGEKVNPGNLPKCQDQMRIFERLDDLTNLPRTFPLLLMRISQKKIGKDKITQTWIIYNILTLTGSI